MATDDLIIEIGAKIDSLIAETAKANQHISAFKEKAEAAGEGLKHFAELVGIAFSVEGIKAFIEHFDELGLQTERVMASLGLTAQQTVLLGGMATITGTSIEGMALSIERMSLNIQRASKDGLTPGAQALGVLGLRASEFKNLNTDQYIEKLHTAVSQFAPSLELTNAVMQVGGRGVAQIIPLLQLSGEKWKEMKAQITAAREGLAEAIPGMADTHAKVSLLSMSVESLGGRIFTVLKPAIDLIVTGMSKWLQSLDTKTIQEFAKSVIDVLGGAIIKLIGFFATLGATIDEVLDKMRRMFTGAAIGGAIGILGGGAGVLLGSMFGGSIGLAYDAWVKQNEEGTKKAGQSIDESTTALVNKVKAMMAAITSAMSGEGGSDHGPSGKKAGAIDQLAAERFAALVAMISGENALWQSWLTQQKTIYQRDADLWQITEQQKLQATRDASTATFQAERENLEQILALYKSQNKLKEIEETNLKIRQLEYQHSTEMIKIEGDMARDIKAKWDEVFGGMQSAFNAQLRGLLAGTTKFRDAFKAICGDMIIFFIQMVEKMAFQWLAGQLGMTAVAATQETAKTTVAATGAAARTGITFGETMGKIGASVGEFFAAVSAFLAPVMGPAAPAAATADAAAMETEAVGLVGGLGGWAIGTDYVPKTGLAMIHKGERIIPEDQNKPGMGSPTFHINISALDGASVASLFMRNGSALVSALHRQARQGASIPGMG